jgi:hypothetical protein
MNDPSPIARAIDAYREAFAEVERRRQTGESLLSERIDATRDRCDDMLGGLIDRLDRMDREYGERLPSQGDAIGRAEALLTEHSDVLAKLVRDVGALDGQIEARLVVLASRVRSLESGPLADRLEALEQWRSDMLAAERHPSQRDEESEPAHYVLSEGWARASAALRAQGDKSAAATLDGVRAAVLTDAKRRAAEHAGTESAPTEDAVEAEQWEAGYQRAIDMLDQNATEAWARKAASLLRFTRGSGEHRA